VSTIRTVIFLIAGKLDFRVINPHAAQPACSNRAFLVEDGLLAQAVAEMSSHA
jgi:hypothetical protein